MSLKLNNTTGGSSTLSDLSTLTDDIELCVRKISAGDKWISGIDYSRGDIVSVFYTLQSGITVSEQYISNEDNNLGNDPEQDLSEITWRLYNVVKYIDTSVDVSVGATGDFPDLNTAINKLGRYTTINGAEIIITLESGHIVDYPVSVRSSYSSIIVRSVDETVTYDIENWMNIQQNTYFISYGGSSYLILEHSIKILGSFSALVGWHSSVFEGTNLRLHGWGTLAAPSIPGLGEIKINTKCTPEAANMLPVVFASCFVGGYKIWMANKVNDGDFYALMLYGIMTGVTTETNCRGKVFYLPGGEYFYYDVTARDDIASGGIAVERMGSIVFQGNNDFRIRGGDNNFDIQVFDGASITLYGSNPLGALSQPANTITPEGIIFDM